MALYDMYKDDNCIFKNNQDRWGDIVRVKAFVICKTEPPPCFSRKIDIFWVVPFLRNRGDNIEKSGTPPTCFGLFRSSSGRTTTYLYNIEPNCSAVIGIYMVGSAHVSILNAVPFNQWYADCRILVCDVLWELRCFS